MKPRWLPNLDADAHNARVRSQRAEMRADESRHRIVGTDDYQRAKADTAAGAGPAGSSADAASSPPSSLGADAATRKGAGSRSLPRSFASAAGAPIYPLVGMCRAAGLPEPVPEYQWHPHRRYRADYAFPLQRVLIEYDGGLFINGGHSRGKARLYDMAKDRAATLLGWRTLRYGVNEMAQTVADLLVLFV